VPRELRARRNSDLFREVNDRILELTDQWASVEPVGFVCECSTIGCKTIVYITAEEYEGVKAVTDRFLVDPAHVDGAHERVVVSTERYAVVERPF
jgi:hypothetical protein